MQSRQFREFGPFRMDLQSRVLFRNGSPVPLTPKVADLLALLVQHPGELLEKSTILGEVWRDTFVEEGNLTQTISVLRKVLGESPAGQPYIETVPKRGYRFTTPVLAETTSAPKRASYRRWLAVAAAAFAVAAVAVGFFLARPRPEPEGEAIVPRPFTTYAGEADQASFSPDGNQVAFAWNGPAGDNFDIICETARLRHSATAHS